ncbi:MAG: hypothetical protein PHW73_00320 [Atribacterota bacterium]|nr:hypothetical protein [Atribacterota bacterium]
MERKNLNKLIPEIIRSRKKPYPVYKYNFKSDKYDYVYNESINEITYWHGRLDDIISYVTEYGTPGITSWDYYCDSEEECAKQVYKMIKIYLLRIKRQNKKRDNGHFRRYFNWQKWISNYESIAIKGQTIKDFDFIDANKCTKATQGW